MNYTACQTGTDCRSSNEPIPVFIYSTSNLARLLCGEMASDSRYHLLGFACDDEYFTGADFEGFPVCRLSDAVRHYPPNQTYAITCGVFRSMRERFNYYLRLKSLGYTLINYISRVAVIGPNVTMGENNIIFGGVYLDRDGIIGNSVIIRPNVYAGHDFRFGDGVFLAPGCNLAGETIIDALSFVGLGANIIGKIKIGKESLIGAGSLVLKDIPEYSRYMGNPAVFKGEVNRETGITL